MTDVEWTFDPSGNVPEQLDGLKSTLATPLSWVVAIVVMGVIAVLAAWLLRRIWLRVAGFASSLLFGAMAHQASQPVFEAILPRVGRS